MGDGLHISVVIHKLLKWFFALISVNQLSVCGAVADMCDELASRISEFIKHGETCCSGQIRDHGRTNRYDDHDQRTSDQYNGARNYEHSQIFQMIFG